MHTCGQLADLQMKLAASAT